MDQYYERIFQCLHPEGKNECSTSASTLPPLLSSKSLRKANPDARNPVAQTKSIETPTHMTWFWGQCAQCKIPGRITCELCQVMSYISPRRGWFQIVMFSVCLCT
jgi:hypothetical protein